MFKQSLVEETPQPDENNVQDSKGKFELPIQLEALGIQNSNSPVLKILVHSFIKSWTSTDFEHVELAILQTRPK